MEEHLKKRPQKRVFQKEVIDFLRNQAIKKIKSKELSLIDSLGRSVERITPLKR